MSLLFKKRIHHIYIIEINTQRRYNMIINNNYENAEKLLNNPNKNIGIIAYEN